MGSSLPAVGRFTSRPAVTFFATSRASPSRQLHRDMREEIPAGGEVDEELKPRVPDLDCGEEEFLTHLLNIYDDQEKVEDADSDDDSEAGPESDEDDDRIEDFIEEGNCAQATTDETKECPD